VTELIYEAETFVIRGAVFEVYKEMGCGFLEAVYQECLEKELKRRSIPYLAQQELRLTYRQEILLQTYRPDLVCFGKIIVELKAVKEIAPEHQAQILNYLKASQLRLGLLINFGSHPQAQIERMIL
jgi:GxxExxY protein